MSQGLTLLSKKSVIEFLEPEKRFLTTARCPSLQRIDRHVPLRLDSLEFYDWGIVINGLSYRLREDRLIFNNQVPRRLPVNFPVALKMLHDYWLTGRKVCANSMVFRLENDENILIPQSPMFKIRTLDSGNLDLDLLIPLIDSSILPLKELRVNLQRSPRFGEHCEISRKLIVTDHENALPLVSRVLAQPEVKSVVLERAPEFNDGWNLVRKWIKTNREIGNSLDMCLPDQRGDSYVLLAWWLFDGTLGFLKESNGLIREGTGICSFIPLDGASEIVIREYKNHETNTEHIKMEVTPINPSYRMNCEGFCLLIRNLFASEDFYFKWLFLLENIMVYIRYLTPYLLYLLYLFVCIVVSMVLCLYVPDY